MLDFSLRLQYITTMKIFDGKFSWDGKNMTTMIPSPGFPGPMI